MTAASLLLLPCLAFAAPQADEPRPTELDGEWREVVPPDSEGSLRVTFRFSRETVTIDLYGQAIQGVFKTEPHWPLSVLVLDCGERDGKRMRVTGVCRLQDDVLYLRLAREDAGGATVGGFGRLAGAGPLRPAPLTLTLERVGK